MDLRPGIKITPDMLASGDSNQVMQANQGLQSGMQITPDMLLDGSMPQVQEQPIQVPDFMKPTVGFLENAANQVTQLGAMTVGLVPNALGSIGGELVDSVVNQRMPTIDNIAKRMEAGTELMDKVTYQPKTESGLKGQEVIHDVLMAVPKAVDAVDDLTGENFKINFPNLYAATQAAGELGPFMVLAKGVHSGLPAKPIANPVLRERLNFPEQVVEEGKPLEPSVVAPLEATPDLASVAQTVAAMVESPVLSKTEQAAKTVERINEIQAKLSEIDPTTASEELLAEASKLQAVKERLERSYSNIADELGGESSPIETAQQDIIQNSKSILDPTTQVEKANEVVRGMIDHFASETGDSLVYQSPKLLSQGNFIEDLLISTGIRSKVALLDITDIENSTMPDGDVLALKTRLTDTKNFGVVKEVRDGDGRSRWIAVVNSPEILKGRGSADIMRMTEAAIHEAFGHVVVGERYSWASEETKLALEKDFQRYTKLPADEATRAFYPLKTGEIAIGVPEFEKGRNDLSVIDRPNVFTSADIAPEGWARQLQKSGIFRPTTIDRLWRADATPEYAPVNGAKFRSGQHEKFKPAGTYWADDKQSLIPLIIGGYHKTNFKGADLKRAVVEATNHHLRTGENTFSVGRPLDRTRALEVNRDDLKRFMLDNPALPATFDGARLAKELVAAGIDYLRIKGVSGNPELSEIIQLREGATKLRGSDTEFMALSGKGGSLDTHFKEWLVNGITKWATSEAEPIGLANKWFKKLADAFKKAFKKEGAAQTPESIRAWMNSMFDSSRLMDKVEVEQPVKIVEPHGGYKKVSITKQLEKLKAAVKPEDLKAYEVGKIEGKDETHLGIYKKDSSGNKVLINQIKSTSRSSAQREANLFKYAHALASRGLSEPLTASGARVKFYREMLSSFKDEVQRISEEQGQSFEQTWLEFIGDTNTFSGFVSLKDKYLQMSLPGRKIFDRLLKIAEHNPSALRKAILYEKRVIPKEVQELEKAETVLKEEIAETTIEQPKQDTVQNLNLNFEERIRNAAQESALDLIKVGSNVNLERIQNSVIEKLRLRGKDAIEAKKFIKENYEALRDGKEISKSVVEEVDRVVESQKIPDEVSLEEAQAYMEGLSDMSVKQGTFFSKLENVIEEKMGGRMARTQLIAMLEKNGVTKDEIDLLDLKEGVVTKEDVRDAIKASKVELKDVVLGESSIDIGSEVRLSDGNLAIVDMINESTGRARVLLNQNAYGEVSRELPLSSLQEYSPSTHFDSYTLPGSEAGSYREMFVTAPSEGKAKGKASPTNPRAMFAVEDQQATWQDGHSQYSSIQNPVVRIRFNEREVEGKRVLFVEEIQGPADKEQSKMPSYLQKRIYDIGVKRILSYAKEKGFDQVAWTTGEMQAERYDLSKQIDEVNIGKWDDETYNVVARKDGKIVANPTDLQERDLADYVGKELAQKAVNELQGPIEGVRKSVKYEGLDLRTGGEGLKRLYDKMIPNLMKKYGKVDVERLNSNIRAKLSKLNERMDNGDISDADYSRLYNEYKSQTSDIPAINLDKVPDSFPMFMAVRRKSKPITGPLYEKINKIKKKKETTPEQASEKIRKRLAKEAEFVQETSKLEEAANKANVSLTEYLRAVGKDKDGNPLSEDTIAKILRKYQRLAKTIFTDQEHILRLGTALGLVDGVTGVAGLEAYIKTVFPKAQGPLKQLTITGRDILMKRMQDRWFEIEGSKFDFSKIKTFRELVNLSREERASWSGWKKFKSGLAYYINQNVDEIATTPAGSSLVHLLKNVLNSEAALYTRDYPARLQRIMELVTDPKDREHILDVYEGKATARNKIFQEGADLMREIYTAYGTEMERLGVRIQYKGGYTGEFKFDPNANHYPHMWEPGSFDKPSEKMLNSLLVSGQPVDAKQAAAIIKSYGSRATRLAAPKFANLEMAREIEMDGYIRDPLKVTMQYLMSGAKRLAILREVGQQPEVRLAQLAWDHFQQSGDADSYNFAVKVINSITGVPIHERLMEKSGWMANPLEFAALASTLQHSAFVQPGVLANTITVAGFKKTAEGIKRYIRADPRKKQMSKEWAETLGANGRSVTKELLDEMHDSLSLATKMDKLMHFWRIPQVDTFFRNSATLTGRLHINEMVERAINLGDKKAEQELRRLGLSSAKFKELLDSGKDELVEDELRKGAYAFAQRTNLVNDALTKAQWTMEHSSFSRMLTLLGRFSFQQHHFLKSLYKDDPKKLVKYLGVASAIGVPGYVAKTLMKGKNPIEDAKERGLFGTWIAMLQNAAGLGMFMDMTLDGLTQVVTGKQGHAADRVGGPLPGLAKDTLVGASKIAHGDLSSAAAMRLLLRSGVVVSAGALPPKYGVPIAGTLGLARPAIETLVKENK